MKSKYKKLNFDEVQTYDIAVRSSKVDISKECIPINQNSSLETFLKSLPDIQIGHDFRVFVEDCRKAIQNGNTFVLMMGAHLIKCGLSPLINKLIQNNIISHLAMNGASAIHDIELSLFGKTSEDVQEGLDNGQFGMSTNISDFINKSLNENENNDLGYGECLGYKLSKCEGDEKNKSIIYNCYNHNIPITVHSALGTEIIHQHPTLNGRNYGEKSLLDFQLFTNSLSSLTKDSIVINIGSAVIMPEIFLKALTIARNLKYQAYGFHTAVFDMIKHYRAIQNVQIRPTKSSGKGYYFIGHFELILPLFIGLLLDEQD